MSSDYDDVDRLLSHMHLKDFSYRSFRRGEPAPPLRVVRSADPSPPAAQVKAPPLRQAKPAPQPPLAPAPEPAVLLPAAVSPTAAAPAVSRISDALQRLAQGSIAASAPKLELHLDLPLPPPPGVAAQKADRSIAEVFRRLDQATLLPPKTAGGGER